MTRPIHLSAATARTSAPSISSLMKLAIERPEIVSLAAGFVDQQSLPVSTTAQAAAQILGDATAGRAALQYGTTIGDEALRAILIERLEVQHGVNPGAYRRAVDRTVLTTGSAQLIYLIGEALLDPGDIVIVESPTYFVFLGPLETRGARAIRTPIDEQGLKIDALEETFARLKAEGSLDRVKLVYTIPEHSNPTGISLAPERRRPLVDLVRRWSDEAGHRIFLLEDSAYHGLSYDQGEAESLWSLDPEGETVILARTFSKTFSPGMKLGYGVLPGGLVDAVSTLKGNHDFGTANFVQKLVRLVLANGEYDHHVGRLREVYAGKRDAFLAALEAHFGPLRDRVSWTRPRGGLYVWMTLPERVDTGFDGPLFRRCLERGVIYVPGEFAFAPEPTAPPRNHLRLTYGVPDEAALAEGASRLAEAVRETLADGDGKTD